MKEKEREKWMNFFVCTPSIMSECSILFTLIGFMGYGLLYIYWIDGLLDVNNPILKGYLQ